MGKLKATFGVPLASSVSQQPKRQDYWTTNDILWNIAVSKAIDQKLLENTENNVLKCITRHSKLSGTFLLICLNYMEKIVICIDVVQ